MVVRPSKRIVAAAALGLGYFGYLPLVLNGVPALGNTLLFPLFLLSLLISAPLVVLVTLGTALEWSQERRDGREVMPTLRHRAEWMAGLSIALLFVLLLCGLLPRALPSGSNLRPFDRASWLAADARSGVSGLPSSRQAMLADALRQLPGRRRAEIEALLGPSSQAAHFQSTGRDLIYRTGPQRDSFMGIDDEWLLIWLDKRGRYQRHAVRND